MKKKHFIILSSLFSVLHALGYIWHGLQTEYTVYIFIMAVLDLLYIPALIFSYKKLFPFYFVVFSLALVLIAALTDSPYFSNYSGLLCIFIGVLIFPRYKSFFMGLYLLFAAVAFTLRGAPFYYFLIHSSRALWAYLVYKNIIYEKYNRKPVIFFDDEKEIIIQLLENKLIKEIELKGMSERTIRRRLDAAKKRNGVRDLEELKELYKKTYNAC